MQRDDRFQERCKKWYCNRLQFRQMLHFVLLTHQFATLTMPPPRHREPQRRCEWPAHKRKRYLCGSRCLVPWSVVDVNSWLKYMYMNSRFREFICDMSKSWHCCHTCEFNISRKLELSLPFLERVFTVLHWAAKTWLKTETEQKL